MCVLENLRIRIYWLFGARANWTRSSSQSQSQLFLPLQQVSNESYQYFVSAAMHALPLPACLPSLQLCNSTSHLVPIANYSVAQRRWAFARTCSKGSRSRGGINRNGATQYINHFLKYGFSTFSINGFT